MLSLARRLARSRYCVLLTISLILSILCPAYPHNAVLADPPPDPSGPSGPTGQQEFIQLQHDIWQQLYATIQEPNACYALDASATFTGPGEYFGQNAYSQVFSVRVVLATDVVNVTESGALLSIWNVLGFLKGTTGVSVPVAGVVVRAIGSGVPIMGFSAVSQLSSADGAKLETAGRPDTLFENLVLTPEQRTCAQRCADIYTHNIAVATATYGLAIAAAGSALAAALYRCALLAAVPTGFNILVGSLCAVAALALFAVATNAILFTLTAALARYHKEYIECLQGCGIPIAWS